MRRAQRKTTRRGRSHHRLQLRVAPRGEQRFQGSGGGAGREGAASGERERPRAVCARRDFQREVGVSASSSFRSGRQHVADPCP
ncbi:hypothetical protein Mapa_017041 [Marchantia paleacea]|nr:hypothetical protein Mapa_017041 [Marchantia paleacea]